MNKTSPPGAELTNSMIHRPNTLELNVDWSVFTEEEKPLVQRAIDQGHFAHIVSLCGDINPSKEAEIERIIALCAPSVEGFDSKVRKDLEKKVAKEEVNLADPAVEAEW